MVDKTKKSPLPEKTGAQGTEKRVTPDQRSSDPTFVRGTIDPSTKKER